MPLHPFVHRCPGNNPGQAAVGCICIGGLCPSTHSWTAPVLSPVAHTGGFCLPPEREECHVALRLPCTGEGGGRGPTGPSPYPNLPAGPLALPMTCTLWPPSPPTLF